MRPEYDFSRGECGVISPDVLDVLPDGMAVNEAVRALAPIPRRRREE